MKKTFLIILLLFIIFIILFVFKFNEEKMVNNIMPNLENYSLNDVKKLASDNNLNLKINEIYSDLYSKYTFVNQSIVEGENLNNNTELIVDYVIGSLDDEKQINIKKYSENKVNELGRIPIMMYHGIHNIPSSETSFIGGNVDKDGYQRTIEAFKNDLKFYYQNNYRMIRLTDYVEGIIDVEIGKSPIIITFDDGLKNNIIVTGLDDNGEIIIDPNCAIGVLEEFKKKYPDYNVTATFFITKNLFNQSEYDDKILKWLVKNGYDVGNHSASHSDFTKISIDETNYQIGSVYEILDEIIPDSYVNIVALPYGSPYKKSHQNFGHILSTSYNGKNYTTKSTMRVGWESDYSPFSTDFDKTFIKRIRAYDNNGVEFDIEANFKNLENNRYISDGDKNKIVIKESDLSKLNSQTKLDVITY